MIYPGEISKVVKVDSIKGKKEEIKILSTNSDAVKRIIAPTKTEVSTTKNANAPKLFSPQKTIFSSPKNKDSVKLFSTCGEKI